MITTARSFITKTGRGATSTGIAAHLMCQAQIQETGGQNGMVAVWEMPHGTAIRGMSPQQALTNKGYKEHPATNRKTDLIRTYVGKRWHVLLATALCFSLAALGLRYGFIWDYELSTVVALLYLIAGFIALFTFHSPQRSVKVAGGAAAGLIITLAMILAFAGTIAGYNGIMTTQGVLALPLASYMIIYPFKKD